MKGDHPWAIAHEGIPGIVIEDPNGAAYTPLPADLNDPAYHTPPSRHVHYHDDDPTVAFPDDVCAKCPPPPAYADEFLAKTAAQKPRFMIPAAADYLACDRTINEERERLRWEYLAYHRTALGKEAREAGIYASDLSTDDLIDAIVDRVCPRAWLDRRLREVL